VAKAATACSGSAATRLSLLGELLAFPPERQPLDGAQLGNGLRWLAATFNGAVSLDDEASQAATEALARSAGEPAHRHQPCKAPAELAENAVSLDALPVLQDWPGATRPGWACRRLHESASDSIRVPAPCCSESSICGTVVLYGLTTARPTVLVAQTGAGHGDLVAALVVPQLLSRAFAAIAGPAHAAKPSGGELAALAALGGLASAAAKTRLQIQRALCDRYGVYCRLKCCTPLTMTIAHRL
jgi:hypothetical protein